MYGSGGHFKEQYSWLVDVLSVNENLQVKGIIDDKTEKKVDDFSKLKIFKSREIIRNDNLEICICVGNISLRKKAISEFKNFNFFNLIHPSSVISNFTTLGKGISIAPNVVISGNVNIGNYNNFNSNTIISHDVQIGQNNFFAASNKIMGSCKIGSNNFFGAGVSTLPGIHIENNNLIGANSLITKNFSSNYKIVGQPATKY